LFQLLLFDQEIGDLSLDSFRQIIHVDKLISLSVVDGHASQFLGQSSVRRNNFFSVGLK
jgi:hypothetical protein